MSKTFSEIWEEEKSGYILDILLNIEILARASKGGYLYPLIHYILVNVIGLVLSRSSSLKTFFIKKNLMEFPVRSGP